jgi:hypothetical protein
VSSRPTARDLARAPALVTIHPSAVLRAGEARDERRAELLADLTLARAARRGRARAQTVNTTKS